MARKYYTLIERDPSSQTWSPQFGDYDRDVVVEEGQSMRDSAMFVKGTKFKIICTTGKQADIDAAVAEINDRLLDRRAADIKAGKIVEGPQLLVDLFKRF